CYGIRRAGRERAREADWRWGVVGERHTHSRRVRTAEVAEQARRPGVAVVQLQRQVGPQLAIDACYNGLRPWRFQIRIDPIRRGDGGRAARVEAAGGRDELIEVHLVRLR